jgi:hypothetical protein
VTATSVTITVDGPMAADAIIVAKDPITMMMTRVPAKPHVDAAEDHHVVGAEDRQMMDQVVARMMKIGVQDDDVQAYRAMTPLLGLLTEPEQKVSSLSMCHLCQSQRVNSMDASSRLSITSPWPRADTYDVSHGSKLPHRFDSLVNWSVCQERTLVLTTRSPSPRSHRVGPTQRCVVSCDVKDVRVAMPI